jgi:homoserine O-acetyltransferase
MSQPSFQSSDSVRSGGVLRHARSATLEGPLDLELGGRLSEVVVAYESWGTLNAARDNAILVCHAISGDSHAARHDAEDDAGWWEILIGSGRPIDTDRFFVLCMNVLGGCRGSTGPLSPNPATGKPYGPDFPQITVLDMVECQRRALPHLGIERLAGVVGGSLGGHQVLTWAVRHPEQVVAAVAIATSPRLTSQAIAFDVVGRNAILRDPDYAEGRYAESAKAPSVGLALARMLGHITYLSTQAMSSKFEHDRLHAADIVSDFEKKFSVGSYLAYQGERFVERFDANSYVTLSMAMDLFDLGADQAALRASLEAASCRWLVISYTSDWLFPPEQSREIVQALLSKRGRVSYCNVTSDCGHDAFLLGDDLDRYGELIRSFLDPDAGAQGSLFVDPDLAQLLHTRRVDYDHIAARVGAEDSVLDLGCGSGELLERLARRPGAGNRKDIGVELSEYAIVECVRRGVDVIHADIDRGLEIFENDAFDVVILSHTLQAVRDVEGVIAEMLRVGHRAIVSFPNAAHGAQRRRLEDEGLAPQASLLESHRWSDPPPLRVLSIRDFELFCKERGVVIGDRVALDTRAGRVVDRDVNRNADLAIFVLERRIA